MVHLVYCDNSGKSGERVLDKILRGEKTMIVRGAAGRKIPHSRVFKGAFKFSMADNPPTASKALFSSLHGNEPHCPQCSSSLSLQQ